MLSPFVSPTGAEVAAASGPVRRWSDSPISSIETPEVSLLIVERAMLAFSLA